jgi:hypothetical protein
MTVAGVLLLIGFGAAVLALLKPWRRVELTELSVTHRSAPPDEPCWTEETLGPDGLSYGRYGCFHRELSEMDARADRDPFITRG